MKGAEGVFEGEVAKVGSSFSGVCVASPARQDAILKWMNGEELKLSNLLACWKGLRGVQGPVWYCALLLVLTPYNLSSQVPRKS